MRSNTFVLLLVFFGIAYFLFARDKKQGPLGRFIREVSQVFSTKPPQENPYQAPESPQTPASGSNEPPISQTTQEPGLLGGLFDKVRDAVLPSEQTAQPGSWMADRWIPASKKSVEVVKHSAFMLGYFEPMEQAAWVVHRLTDASTRGDASRQGMEFRPDSRVNTQSALSTDYSRSGYDRGHLVPAGDFRCCTDLMYETFFMSNISPQDRDFNRYIWNDTEQKVRNWARGHGELMVYTGPVFGVNTSFIGRYNRVGVPEAFYKIVYFESKGGSGKVKMLAFLVPNANQPNLRPLDFVVSVDEVERRTGLDFFHFLADAREAKLESSINPREFGN